MMALTRVVASLLTMMAAGVLLVGLTLVWVVVRLVVGGALALLIPRSISTGVREGMAGGVSETTARMFVFLRTIQGLGLLLLGVGRHLSLGA